MAERGVDLPYESVRRWIDKFGQVYAKRIRVRYERPSSVWHLGEVFTKINGNKVYIWCAVDDEGTVLDILVQRRKNRKAALRLMRKLLRRQGVGGRKNNRAECSHVPIRRRERKAQKFRSIKAAQRLLSAHSQIYNLFNFRRHLISRPSLRKFRSITQNEWDIVTASACA